MILVLGEEGSVTEEDWCKKMVVKKNKNKKEKKLVTFTGEKIRRTRRKAVITQEDRD
jgi:hypothetical protein